MRISDWSSDVCSSDLPIVLARRKLDHAQRLAHAPAGDHLAGNGRRLLYVAFGAGGAGAVDDFLRGATAQHADDLRAQISLGIVVSVGRRSLVSEAKRSEDSRVGKECVSTGRCRGRRDY